MSGNQTSRDAGGDMTLSVTDTGEPAGPARCHPVPAHEAGDGHGCRAAVRHRMARFAAHRKADPGKLEREPGRPHAGRDILRPGVDRGVVRQRRRTFPWFAVGFPVRRQARVDAVPCDSDARGFMEHVREPVAGLDVPRQVVGKTGPPAPQPAWQFDTVATEPVQADRAPAIPAAGLGAGP